MLKRHKNGNPVIKMTAHKPGNFGIRAFLRKATPLSEAAGFVEICNLFSGFGDWA
jgi:hypothetical protein